MGGQGTNSSSTAYQRQTHQSICRDTQDEDLDAGKVGRSLCDAELDRLGADDNISGFNLDASLSSRYGTHATTCSLLAHQSSPHPLHLVLIPDPSLRPLVGHDIGVCLCYV